MLTACQSTPAADNGDDEMSSPTQESAALLSDDGVGDEYLVRFADAVISLYEMDQQLDIGAKFDEAESGGEVAAISHQLFDEMQRRVQKAGLDIDEYMVIRERVEKDPELQQRLAEIIEEKGAEELIEKRD